MVAEFQ